MRRLALFAVLAAACAAEAPSSSSAALTGDLTPPKLDILFVVDNSGSMAQEQASLAANLPGLLDQVAASAGAVPDLHIGVVSSSVGIGDFSCQGCNYGGDRGLLQVTPRIDGCSPPTGHFIEDAPGGEVNYSGTLADTFSCIALLGTAGCGFEQHLESMKQALDGSNPGNAGFLRDDAMLAIVILADEDDCSAADPSVFDTHQCHVTDPLGAFEGFRCTEFGVICDGANLDRNPDEYSDCSPRTDSYMADPAGYVAFLTSLKGGESWRVFAAVIAGPTSPFAVVLDSNEDPRLAPSCSSAMGKADPAVSLASFAAAFPHHKVSSI